MLLILSIIVGILLIVVVGLLLLLKEISRMLAVLIKGIQKR